MKEYEKRRRQSGGIFREWRMSIAAKWRATEAPTMSMREEKERVKQVKIASVKSGCMAATDINEARILVERE